MIDIFLAGFFRQQYSYSGAVSEIKLSFCPIAGCTVCSGTKSESYVLHRCIGGVEEAYGPVPLVIYIICPTTNPEDLRECSRLASKLLSSGAAGTHLTSALPTAIEKPAVRRQSKSTSLPAGTTEMQSNSKVEAQRYGGITLGNQYDMRTSSGHRNPREDVVQPWKDLGSVVILVSDSHFCSTSLLGKVFLAFESSQ